MHALAQLLYKNLRARALALSTYINLYTYLYFNYNFTISVVRIFKIALENVLIASYFKFAHCKARLTAHVKTQPMLDSRLKNLNQIHVFTKYRGAIMNH